MRAFSRSWPSGDVHVWESQKSQISTIITSIMHLGRLGFLKPPQSHPSKKEHAPRGGMTAYDFSNAITKTRAKPKTRSRKFEIPKILFLGFSEREGEGDGSSPVLFLSRIRSEEKWLRMVEHRPGAARQQLQACVGGEVVVLLGLRLEQERTCSNSTRMTPQVARSRPTLSLS